MLRDCGMVEPVIPQHAVPEAEHGVSVARRFRRSSREGRWPPLRLDVIWLWADWLVEGYWM